MFARYNAGLDIHQTQDYTKLSCETCIDCMLKTHGWESPGSQKSDRFDSIPLLPSLLLTSLSTQIGPKEGTPEFAKVEKAAGFGYRQVLGELIYAYVTCRLNIGYAVTFLARHAQSSTAKHYAALKHVVHQYLGRKKD
jgi:hypothetical protein